MQEHCEVGQTDHPSPLADDPVSSVTLHSSLKEEFLAPASIVVSPVEMGKNSASNIAIVMLKPIEIVPGTYMTCVMIKPSDIKSPETVPSSSKGIQLVNTSNHSAPILHWPKLSVRCHICNVTNLQLRQGSPIATPNHLFGSMTHMD